MSTRRTIISSAIIGTWLGILAGAVVGGVAVLLLTPKKGIDTRNMIKTRFTKAGEAIIWHARDEVQKVQNRNINKK